VLSDEEFPKKSSTVAETEQICCKNEFDIENCSGIIDGSDEIKSQWMCTGSVVNTFHGLRQCPFKKTSCGPFSTVKFYETGEEAAIHVKDFDAGEVCTYNI